MNLQEIYVARNKGFTIFVLLHTYAHKQCTILKEQEVKYIGAIF